MSTKCETCGSDKDSNEPICAQCGSTWADADRQVTEDSPQPPEAPEIPANASDSFGTGGTPSSRQDDQSPLDAAAAAPVIEGSISNAQGQDDTVSNSDAESGPPEVPGQSTESGPLDGDGQSTDNKNQPTSTPPSSKETAVAAELVEDDSILLAETVPDVPPLKSQAGPAGQRSPFATGYDLGAVNRQDERQSIWTESFAARGGAVGAMVLGTMAIPGAFLTSASSITAFLGIVMGCWGLLSNYKRMAIGGIALCVICLVICVYRLSFA